MLRVPNISLPHWKQRAYILALIAIFLISVRIYSGWFTPVLNSDNAVHVLMAQDFQFPENLYYWGQDRRGSFEPALVALVLQGLANLGLSASPLLLLSIVQFSLITIAFCCFSKFLRHRLSKLTFALIWFLPPIWFHDLLMLAQPYYAQLACLGLGLWGISTLESQAISTLSLDKERNSIPSLWLVSLVVISFFCSLWISELSALILLGLCVHLRFVHLSRKATNIDVKNSHSVISLRHAGGSQYWAKWITIAGWSAACVFFLNYAKQHAIATKEYTEIFSSGNEILINVSRIVTRLWPVVTFRVGNFFLSFSLLGLLICLPFCLKVIFSIESKKGWLDTLSSWKVFFLGCSCCLFVFLLVSKWVYLNEAFPRYFALPFVLGSLGLLIGLEDSPPAYRKKTAWVLLVLACASALSFPVRLGEFFSDLSFPANLEAIYSTPSTREQLKDFKDLPNSGFIGDYWTSYLICSVAPEVLSCTPHQESVVRCQDCVDKVFAEETAQIYLVQDLWLEHFPDEISQFERKLLRSGPSQTVGSYVLAPYRIASPAHDVRTP